MADSIPVRFIYRSESMVPLLTVMEKADVWKKNGIDVRDYRFGEDPLDAEEQLLDGGIDFIFGNHVSPYMRLAHGEPMVCMAQTENWLHRFVATDPSITDLSTLTHKRVVGRPLFLNGKFTGHGDGNHIILLEGQGVDTKQTEFILPNTVGNPIEAVRDGKADACFIDPNRAGRAEEAGLLVHRLAPLPMVHSITFTSIWPRINQHDGLAEKMMKVLVESTHFFKTQKDQVLDMLKEPVGPMRPGQMDRVAGHYDEHAKEYETKPFPRAEALINVHKLACMVYPEARTVNPLELWDTQTLRNMFASGYVDQLYGGRDKVIASISDTLNHGECDD